RRRAVGPDEERGVVVLVGPAALELIAPQQNRYAGFARDRAHPRRSSRVLLEHEWCGGFRPDDELGAMANRLPRHRKIAREDLRRESRFGLLDLLDVPLNQSDAHRSAQTRQLARPE